MQAQPQSIPAARINVAPFPPPPAAPPPMALSHPPPDNRPQPHAQPVIRYLLAASSAAPAVPAVAPPSHPSQPALRTAPPPRSPGIAQAAGLAHDAGNLLGALGLYCDLLRAPGVLRPEHRHYATELSLISARSAELIQRLIAAPSAPQQAVATAPPETPTGPPQPFRTASGPVRLQPADTRRRPAPLSSDSPAGPSLVSALSDLLPVLQRITAGAACVSVRSPATLPPTALSVEALERITVNLVRNAAEAIRTQRLHGSPRTASPGAAWPAARPAGQIRVALAIVAGRLQLTVEDDGPGVPPAIAAAFLQPRPLPAHTSRGLGHRIVHELVTSTGGQLSLRVRPGKGTAFCIKWPIPHAAAERFDAANLPAPPTPPSLSLQGESSPC